MIAEESSDSIRLRKQVASFCDPSSSVVFTYLVNTISVHQRRLVYPVNIESTELEHELHVRRLRCGSRRGGAAHGGVVAGGSIVGTGGVRLLWGRNERHALERATVSFFVAKEASNTNTSKVGLYEIVMEDRLVTVAGGGWRRACLIVAGTTPRSREKAKETQS
jgi:hypothetical protein